MTVANVQKSSGGHWYYPDSTPCFEVPKKSGNGMKKTTLREARELGLLPSVTTILRVLDKPALNAWLIEQSVLAVVTTPRKAGEKDDEFIHRVLHEERVQDAEAATAADRGTQIHDAIANALEAKEFDPQFKVYVEAVLPVIEFMGKVRWVEKILVGNGYAGRSDILIEGEDNLALLDFKSAKTLPKTESWTEHRLQSSAYAAALGNTGDKRLITGNIYLSTTLPGQTALFLQDDWRRTYEQGFVPLLKLWSFLNSYVPGGQP